MLFFLLHFKMRNRSNDMEKGELCRWILGGWADGGGGATAESSVANVVLCTNRCKRNDGVLMKQEICGGAVDCLFERNKKKGNKV